MQPGDTVVRTIRRKTIFNTAASTSYATSDFTLPAYYNGAAASISAVVAYLGAIGTEWSVYSLTFVVPAGEGLLDIYPKAASGTDIVDPGGISVEIETYDLKALANILAVPTVSVVDQGGPQGDIGLRVVKNTYAPVAFTARDTSGTAIDLSTWTNAKFNVMSQDQTTTVYSQTTGITMTAGGLITIGIPETATFYAALTTGNDQKQLYWNFLADDSGDATKTRCLGRGLLTILRTEV